MSYYDVAVVIGGAEDYSEDLDTYAEVEQVNDQEALAALEHGLHTQIYVVHHDHAVSDEECACVQYLQDHHPTWEYNVP